MEGWREGGREGGKERGREGGREGEREGGCGDEREKQRKEGVRQVKERRGEEVCR